jgi:putative glutathione S-transferase
MAEPDRYHLYIARACPWAHRTAIFRELKGLDTLIGLSVTHWLMGDEGWTFDPAEGVIPDTVNQTRCVHELYRLSDATVSGRATVPILWDKRRRCIVSNESADIIRMFNTAFDAIGATPGDFYPEALRGQIDGYNARIYDTVNNGVYKAGFAGTQAAYEEAVYPLFDALDWLESHLRERRYLCGDTLTEADWRLFTTLLRFDAAYHGHFKCNLRRLVDYPVLLAYTRALYQVPGIRGTVDFAHIKKHYYLSHPWLDPTGIVPAGPGTDFDTPLPAP